jgi:putative ABC transport system substrate-binding protein
MRRSAYARRESSSTASFSRPADGRVDYIYPIAGGTKPADLPIERPARFGLSVNGRVARDLGITLTPTILACAEEVIE